MGHYMVTCHRPTAITHSLVASVTGKDAVNLILARPNRIEIHLVTEDGLKGLHDVPIYGTIACMDVFRVPGESQDMIFILTERSHFCILSYDANASEIRTRGLGDMSDHIGQQSQGGKLGVVDPQCRMVALRIYEGALKIIPVDLKGQVRESFNVYLEEPCVIDLKFLYGCSKPTIAILYEGNKGRWVQTHVVNSRGRELLSGPWERISVESDANTLIPVPEPLCGVMVIGKRSIAYCKGGNTVSIDMVSKSITAYGPVDEDGQRFLVGDTNGELYVITLIHDGTNIKSLSLEPLGSITIPSCISYLDSGVVFIGSVSGDSQLIKLKQAPEKGTDSYIEVLDMFANLGPIVDMALVDVDNQGQYSAVTCSGIAKDGSLRVVQSGIGINEQASIELPGIKDMWSLRPSSEASFDKYLVQAFLSETRVLAIEEDEMEEVELPSFLPGRTLFCGNMNGNVIVQVTELALVCLRVSDMTECARWHPPMGLNITIARANSAVILVACGGGTLVLLEVDANTYTVLERGTMKLEHEIACMCLNSDPSFMQTTIRDEGGGGSNTGDSGNFDAMEEVRTDFVSGGKRKGDLDGFAAAATWIDKTIRLFTLPDLTVRAEQILSMDTQARSVALVTLEAKHFLVVGLGDGTMLSFPLDVSPESSFPLLGSHRKVVLGTQVTSLTPIVSKGSTCVFVTSDRSTVMHSQYGKLMYASVSMAEISSMCSFHTKNYPDCLALANSTSLTIGMLDEIQKLHIRNIPLGRQPRRLSYSKEGRLFSVATCSGSASGGQEGDSIVLFLDDMSFSTVDTYVLDACEEPTSSCVTTLVTSTSHHGNGNGNDDSGSSRKNNSSSQQEYILVGTAYILPGSDNLEPTSGRILVFGVKGEETARQVYLVTEKEIEGCAYCMEGINGNLAVGCNNMINLYTLQETPGGEGVELVNTASHKGQVITLCLRTHGDFIVYADLMRSVGLLAYSSVDNTVKEIACDFTTYWMNAVEVIDDETFIGAENEGNLFVLRKNTKGESDEERARLQLQGDFHAGEYVNVFRRGTLIYNPSRDEENAYVAGTCLLYGTVSGSIGAVLNLTPEGFNLFNVVEKAMEKVVQGVGGLKHSDWRAFRNVRRIAVQSLNFVDGDLVESFLDLKPEHQKKVVQIMHSMAEAKVPLTSNEDTKEEEYDGLNTEALVSWNAISKVTVEGLSQAIESIIWFGQKEQGVCMVSYILPHHKESASWDMEESLSALLM